MAQKEYIKHLYEVEEKSLRKIAEICELNFRTVQKYAKEDDWNARKKLRASREVKISKYTELINGWLEQDQKAPRKQRHTMMRIYNRLVQEAGYDGSYQTVRNYVVSKKAEMSETRGGYLPLKHDVGCAEIDFGEFAYENGLGELKKAYHLTMTFPYSNAGYVQVFKGQNQECLLEGMKRIFARIGGVPKRIKADNMSVAVVKVLEEGKRELTEGFVRFKLHYRFEADFCNPSSGNEKGNVENKVGYSRRNFFVPIPAIEDFDEFNANLLLRCEADMERDHYSKGISIKDLWDEDRQALLNLPVYEYEVFRYETVRINNYGFVTVDTNKYGLSPELSGKMASVKIYCNHIEIYHDHALLKTYERSYGDNEEVTDWKQYLSVLCKKPGAAEHTRFFNQMPKLWREHLLRLSRRERKSALMLLNEIVKDDALETGNEAVELAALYGRSDTESIRHCYYALTHGENKPAPIQLSSQTPVINYSPNLSVYDVLTEGVR